MIMHAHNHMRLHHASHASFIHSIANHELTHTHDRMHTRAHALIDHGALPVCLRRSERLDRIRVYARYKPSLRPWCACVWISWCPSLCSLCSPFPLPTKPRRSDKLRASFLPFYMDTHYCTVVFKDREQVRGESLLSGSLLSLGWGYG